jgi:hypothetical protein
MTNASTDSKIVGERIARSGRTMRVLRGIWRAFLRGAAVYAAAIDGYPKPDDL